MTVSTTGLAVPSLDAILANRLGLPATIERLPIFGLGCAGGVSGLARAARMAQSLPKGNVLLLVVELCTINCRNTDHTIKNFISAALFGDGAAALLLRRASDGKALPRLVASGEHMWRRSEYMMGWSIEDDGFGVVLSPDIPKCAREELRPAVDHFLARHGLVLSDLDGIIMHPGGRKVLEAAQTALELAARGASSTPGTSWPNTATCRRRRHCSCSSAPCRRALPVCICWPRSGRASPCLLPCWISDP